MRPDIRFDLLLMKKLIIVLSETLFNGKNGNWCNGIVLL